MTVKEFFKSTAFKCLAVLTSVLLVSGILLAVCWGFLEVTDEERFNRKIGSVYGSGVNVTATEQDLSGKNLSVGDATIEKLWYIEEKSDYLVQASAQGNGGSVTCWITVNMDGTTVTGIGKVILYAVGDPAEFKDNISSGVYDRFAADYTDGKQYSYGDKTSPEYIYTGASNTLTAICNDVNAAVTFVKAYASGGDVVDPYKDFVHRDRIDMDKTTYPVDGETVNYDITTKRNGDAEPFRILISVDATQKIVSFSIVVNGSTEYDGTKFKDHMSPLIGNLVGKNLADIEGYLADTSAGGALHTGATLSNTLCYEAAAFALANYSVCIAAAADTEVTE